MLKNLQLLCPELSPNLHLQPYASEELPPGSRGVGFPTSRIPKINVTEHRAQTGVVERSKKLYSLSLLQATASKLLPAWWKLISHSHTAQWRLNVSVRTVFQKVEAGDFNNLLLLLVMSQGDSEWSKPSKTSVNVSCS